MFQKILVALDLSDTSNRVFEEALILARANHAKLMLLHVLTPFESQYPTAMYPMTDGIYPLLHERAVETYMRELGEFEQQGLATLRSLTESALTQGITTEFTQNIGHPGRVICALARTWDADLIILGRRGLSGLNELFLGSVSNYVTHHAPCSVLTVQGRSSRHPEAEHIEPPEAIVVPNSGLCSPGN